MKYVAVLLLCFALILAALLPQVLVSADRTETLSAEFTERVVRYSFLLSNRSNQPIETVAFKAFAPVKRTPYQEVTGIEANAPFEILVDAWGNQELLFSIDGLGPYGQQVITITASVRTQGQPEELNLWSSLGPLAPEALIDSGAAELQRTLAEVSAGTSAGSGQVAARQIQDWVVKNFRDTGFSAESRGVSFALAARQGDCSEYTQAWVAIARANHISALPVAGFRLFSENAILRATDYHNWALFRQSGSWKLADPHGNQFNENQGDYVAFRVFVDNPDQLNNAQRFWTEDARIQVSMN